MNKQEELVNELLDVLQHIKRNHHGTMPKIPIRKSEMFTLMNIGNLLKKYPDGIKLGSLSQALNLAPPTVTPMINSLEENGFIERVGSKEDRRVVYIRLTQMGQSFLDEKENHFKSNINKLVNYLGEEDAKTFIRIVRKTADFLSQLSKENEGNSSD
jgi:DNA-binding MarR family transcriptional regulator